MFLMDCSDYFHQLSIEYPNPLEAFETETKVQKIHVSPVKRTRHDEFVSTAPDQKLHYEEKVRSRTLDGYYKPVKTLSGNEVISWRGDQNEAFTYDPYENKYFP